jgi:hypothetical protein
MNAHAQQNRSIQPHPTRRYLAVMLIVGFPLDDPSRPSGTDGLSRLRGNARAMSTAMDENQAGGHALLR